jgi:hypothetical protein
VAKDYAKAREWFEKAADKDDAFAMTRLGALYHDGLGGAQDYAKAREWFEKAADKDDAWAMSSLGALYANGQGVAQDYAKAREWYEKAVDKGDAGAMTGLGVLYANGQGVAQDYAKAREWYEKAADNGHAGAMYNLAVLYANGQGVAQDYAKALKWREAYAAKVEAEESERLGKPGENTARALNEVAWSALFAREFTKALAVADRAHALLPDDLMIETNRAHAVMFVKGGEECKALYVAYKGRSLRDGQLWERIIVGDFAKFRKAGLTRPVMADIEKALGVSP